MESHSLLPPKYRNLKAEFSGWLGAIQIDLSTRALTCGFSAGPLHSMEASGHSAPVGREKAAASFMTQFWKSHGVTSVVFY